MKHYFLLFCIGFCLLVSSCGKAEMTPETEKRLIQLYNDSYKISDPAKLNATAEEILHILSGVEDNIIAKACRIHAHIIRGFAACVQKDKPLADKELKKALDLLPEIRDTKFHFKWAAELYSVFGMTHFDDPQKAEYWLNKLESLVENEMKGKRFLHDSRDYRIMVQIKKYECLLCRAEYLTMQKKDFRQVEKLLLNNIPVMEEKAKEFSLPPLLYGYDLLSEIYYCDRNEKMCREYAKKTLVLAAKYDSLPKFADEHLYEICMKEKDYPAALDCCLTVLNLSSVQSKSTRFRRKYLLRAAGICEKLNDPKNAEEYRKKAEKINAPSGAGTGRETGN